VVDAAACGYKTAMKTPRTIAEIMTRAVAVVAPETRLRDALELMQTYAVRHLPVLDQERLVGFLTETDLREAIGFQLSAKQLKERLDWAVYRVMNEQFTSLASDASLASAVDVLISSKAGALPVVDPTSDELAGILSVIDVLVAARPLFDAASALRSGEA
jgi:acetoin utilization protein AcuB